MTERPPRLFAITGGPGAGKTTLIDALARTGVVTVPETGRAVIREQQAQGGRALPWIDPATFAAAMLAGDVAAYDAHRAAETPVVFDRGIPDVIGYLRLEGLAVPDAMPRAAEERRYAQVFVCPPWPDIYTIDAERRQTPEIAERTYRAMIETYSDLGYALVEVPRVAVGERVRFLLDAIAI